MEIPDEKKVEVEEKDENFDDFISKLNRIPTATSKEILININNDLQTINSRFNGLVDLAKMQTNTATKLINEKLQEIELEYFKPTEFHLNTLKENEQVESVTTNRNQIIIVTKPKQMSELKDTDGEIMYDWEMPSYTITYTIKEVPIINYPGNLDPYYNMDTNKYVLGYTVKLTNEKDIEKLKPLKVILDNENEITQEPKAIINPYIDASVHTEEGYPSVCFGESSSMQASLLEKGELFHHFLNLLVTLHTEDDTGEGYSKWREYITRNLTIERSLIAKSKLKTDLVYKTVVTTNLDENNYTLDEDNYTEIYGYSDISFDTNKPLISEASQEIKDKIKLNLNSSDDNIEIDDNIILEEIIITNEDKLNGTTDGIRNLILNGTAIYDSGERSQIRFKITPEEIGEDIKFSNEDTEFSIKDINKLTTNIYENSITI